MHFLSPDPAPPGAALNAPANQAGEADVHRRTQLLEALIDSTFDGVLIVSPEGKMIFYNQLFLDIWNFPEHIIASKSDEAALQWAAAQTMDPTAFLAGVVHSYRNPERKVREEIKLKDGRRYERCGSEVKTGDGHQPWMWTFRDITDRHRNEKALELSEHRYRTLFNSMEEGFCVIEMLFDQNGKACDYRYLEINPAFVVQTGITDAVGRTIREIAPAHEQHWVDFYGEIVRTGKPARYEHVATALARWFEVYAFPVEKPHLNRVGVLFTDVTKRHAAAEAMRKTEQFRHAVMESSPDCIKVLDADARLQFMNTAGKCLMEIDDFGPLVQKPWCELWRPEDQPMVEAAIADALSGRTARFQAMCPTAKGTVKWWDVMIAPILGPPGSERATGLVSVSRDITESKQAEKILRDAKEAAESASRAKDRFLATLSHELRNPLNPVLLVSSALSEDPTLPAVVREQLKMIERNVSLEARLIDDLLDLTRVSTGKLILKTEPCDCHHLLGLVIEMVRPEAVEKATVIESDLRATRHHLSGDPARLQQIFWNLLRNAVKFTPPGGRVMVRTMDVPATPDSPAGLRLEIEDTGMGITPELLDSIFNPFEQESRLGGHSPGGLGLGLAIARSLVALHHGTLRAQSAGPGQGATFIMECASRLPFAGPAAGPAEAADAERALLPEPPMRLLLVEDHEETLDALTKLLRKAGHQVTPAKTVAQ
ncbi:MAG: DNA-binding response regulator, OmpR family, containings and winged-helix, partial [Verrucomicrobiales bacterium]|nr:DNA-binding response regulator, OmpR family, containings and winged-helix [Verrucomicrobiales bacterium]